MGRRRFMERKWRADAAINNDPGGDSFADNIYAISDRRRSDDFRGAGVEAPADQDGIKFAELTHTMIA
jgi:hypothetical protein